MKCPSCNADNASDQNYCRACGVTLGGAQASGGRRETPLEEYPTPAKQAYVPPAPRRTVHEDADEPVRAPAPAARAAYVPPQPPSAPQATAPPQARVGTAAGVPARRPDRTRLDEDEAPIPAPQGGRHVERIVGWMVSFDVNETGQDYLLREGRTRVGRGQTNDISLFYDATVSDYHATIICAAGRAIISDEKTHTGTIVNGEDLRFLADKHPLKNGDLIKIGKSTFKLFLLDLEETRQIWPRINAK